MVLSCFCVVARWLPACMFLLLSFLPSCWFSLSLRGLGLVPLFAFVPVPFLVSSRSCWRFFFPSVVPFWFRFLFLSRPFSGGGVFLLWFWQFLAGALPCGGGGVRGGVVFSSFLCSFLRVVGWGWLGWLFYYQIQKFPVVSFSVPCVDFQLYYCLDCSDLFVLEDKKINLFPVVQKFSLQEFCSAVQDFLPRNL